MRTSAIAAFLALSSLAPQAMAAGRLRAGDRHLDIKSIAIKARLEDELMTVEIDQVFTNASSQPAEAVYDFPLPPRAVFSGLSIWKDGQEIQGEIIERKRAEAVYEDVTGAEVESDEELRERGAVDRVERRIRKKDPALLQIRGRVLRLRVAPVPARGEARVRIRYVQPPLIEGGEGRLIIPLVLDTVEAARVQRLSARIALRSLNGLASVWSPSHPEPKQIKESVPGAAFDFAIDEDGASLDRDVELRYRLQPSSEPRLMVRASRRPGEPGRLRLTLIPWFDAPIDRPRKVMFVVDISASMSDRRERVETLIKRSLRCLDGDDQFNILAVHLGAECFTSGFVDADRASREKALAWLRTRRYAHAADPMSALRAAARIRRAARDPRPADVVLVTDPALSDQVELLQLVGGYARRYQNRVFAFELGGGAQAQPPLARLAEGTGGIALSVPPGDERYAAFFTMNALGAATLERPQLRLVGAALSEASPSALPRQVRRGSAITISGVYAKPGRATLVLTGQGFDGKARRWALPFRMPEAGKTPEVDRLWAADRARDIEAELAAPGLSAARSAALERALLRTSLRGPILTRKTSLLTLESEALFDAYAISRENRERVAREKAAEETRAVELDAAIRDKARRRSRLQARGPDPAEQSSWSPLNLPKSSSSSGGRSGGGGGGGAGGPLFLGLALAAGLAAFKKRRAA